MKYFYLNLVKWIYFYEQYLIFFQLSISRVERGRVGFKESKDRPDGAGTRQILFGWRSPANGFFIRRLK